MGRTAKLGFGLALIVGLSLSGVSSAGAEGGATTFEERKREALERINGVGALGSVSAAAVVRSPYAALDRRNDEVPKYAEGDITSYGTTYRTSVTLSIRTQVAKNAQTAGSWKFGVTFIAFGVDVNRNSSIDYFALFANDGSGNLVAELFNASGSHRCNASAQQYAPNGYRVSFHRLCLGQIPSFRTNTFMVYDRYWNNPNAPTSFDDVPSNALSPHVFPG